MPVLSYEYVRRLAQAEPQAALSIYLPTHRGGPELREDAVRLKNRISDAERQIDGAQWDRAEFQPHLDRLRELVKDGRFWRWQSDGLAIFVSRDGIEISHVPLKFDELTVVGSDFHILPLIPAVEDGSEFHIVAISRNRARLLQGTRYAVGEVAIDRAPQGVNDLFINDDTSDQLQFRTIASTDGGDQTSLFHGQGGTERPQEERLLHYFRQIDTEVRRALGWSRAPLIFAGDAPLFPLYQRANQYGNLMDAFIRGNPDELSMGDIHAKAVPIMEEKLRASQEHISQRVSTALAGGRCETKPATLLLSALSGRVDLLLVARGSSLWGTVDPEKGQVQVHPERTAQSEELLNLAAVHTLRHGGVAVVQDPSVIPDQNQAVGVLRF